MPKYLWAVILSMTYCVTVAQSLVPGDTMPSLILNGIFNNDKSQISLSDLKGRLVIFDFWDVTCTSCIQAFPKMDSLQKKFKDQIQIILVNRQERDSTMRFFSKRKRINIPDLPFVTGDSVLHTLFPHEGAPFHVWIDSAGVVSFLSEGRHTNYENIRDFLAGKAVNIPAFKENTYISSFIDEKWKRNLIFYSYLAKFEEGIQLLSSVESESMFAELTYSGYTVPQLYLLAYNEVDKHNFGRPGRFFIANQCTFREDPTLYNYQLFFPKEKGKSKFEMMKQDLKRYFGVNAKVEKQSVRCFVLERASGPNRMKTKGGKHFDNFFSTGIWSLSIDSIRSIKNRPFKLFADRLERMFEFKFKAPFINATGYLGNIDIEMKGSTLDDMNLVDLRKELGRYNLRLVERFYSVEVLMLRCE